jgi:hypothetical protein
MSTKNGPTQRRYPPELRERAVRISSISGSAYRSWALAVRVHALRFRNARGPVKRLWALLRRPTLLARVPGSGGNVLWVHLRRPECDPVVQCSQRECR